MSNLIARLRMGTQVPEFELRQEAADEIERLRERLEIAGAHPFPKDFDALDLAVERNKALMAEIERLQKAYRPADMIEYQELVAENERLRAALEQIANLPPGHICDAREIAREALHDE